MKNVIKIAVVFFFASAALWRCGSDAEYDVPKQDTTFRDFLQDIQSSYESSLAAQYGLYKVTNYRSFSDTTAERGDTLSIDYSGFTFNKSSQKTFGMQYIFTTNNPRDTFGTGWVENELFPLKPFTFVLGTGQTLRGIDLGLENSQQSDSVRLYLTSDLAYGGNTVGLIEPGTPVVFKVFIKEVRKKR